MSVVTIPECLSKLLTNEGYDYAAVQFTNRPPMVIQRSVCKSKIEGDCLVLDVPDGPHPVLEGKNAAALHHLPLASIVGISYYSDNVIKKQKSSIIT